MPTNNEKLYKKYLQKMESLHRQNNVSKDIFNAFLNGKNSYLRLTRSESSHFDPSWIKVIEDCLYDLGDIVNNPKQVTKTESDIVPVELAKKINGESVTHLASHTQYIKDLTDSGDVVPSKILSHFNEDDIHTYENRFIATFIRRLVLFIQKRYDFVLKTIPDYVDEVMIIKNSTVVNGQTVDIETKIRVKKESDDDVSVAAKAYAERIKTMMEYVVYYYNSPFMKKLKTEKDVRKPILQTNIIRKNPKYRKCYETFTFIEKYDSLGVTYKVDEKYTDFTQKDREEINNLFLSSYLAMKDTTNYNKVKTNNKVYKPKIRSSIDDEHFVFGELYKGPIEFVRVDEEYRKYLQSQIRTDLPQHPTRVEKEYYADDYRRNREIKEELKEIERLLARKQREIAKFEKQIAKIIAEREREEAELARLMLLAKEEEEQRRIELKRQEIIAAAKQKEEEMRELLEKEREELARLEALRALEEAAEEVSEQEPEDESVTDESESITKEETVEDEPVLEEEQPEEIEESQPVEEPQEDEPLAMDEASNEEVAEEQPAEEIQEQNEEPVVEETPVEEVPQEVVEPQPEENLEEAPAEEIVEAAVVTEAATIEEASEPIEEQPVAEEETPVEEEVASEVVEAPIEEEKPKKARRSRKKKEEQPSEDVLSSEEPTAEQVTIEQPVEDAPVTEEPVKEQPLEEPKPKKTRKPRKKKEPEVEETPVEEPQQEEPLAMESQPEEIPEEVKEEQPIQEEKPKRTRKPRQKKEKVEEPVVEQPQEEEPLPVEEAPNEKKARKPRAKKKAAPKKEKKPEPVEEEPKVIHKGEPEILQVIPGKFIVKAYEGYYIDDKHFSVYKKDAKIFYDFNKARLIKARFGGKVIKL